MTRTIEIIIHADKITALDFLKDNPTLVLQNGKYFKFIYFEPTGAGLQKLEASKLNEERKGLAIELNGWIFDIITNGIYTKEDTALFIRLLFLHGYSFEQVTQLYSSIVKRMALNKYFLENMKIIYKGVSI